MRGRKQIICTAERSEGVETNLWSMMVWSEPLLCQRRGNNLPHTAAHESSTKNNKTKSEERVIL